jgi:hypothetical protein
MVIRYTKWLSNISNAHKIVQHLPLQDPPKLTQIWIVGLKINHLATPVHSRWPPLEIQLVIGFVWPQCEARGTGTEAKGAKKCKKLKRRRFFGTMF